MTNVIKVNMEKVNEVKDTELVNAINGINALPSLKDRIEGAMSQSIDSDKIKSIFSKQSDISILNDKELLSFFRVIFNQVKDPTFNPENFILPNETKKVNSKGKSTKVSTVYQPRFKKKFLENHLTSKGTSYSKETKRVANILFGKTGKIETSYNMDLYSFDNNQFEEVLISLEATTLRSLQNSISTLEQYIDFAIAQGKAPAEKGNIATRYSSEKVISQFLDKKADTIILSKDEIYSISEYSENAQDGVILNLLFDGISHKRKFVELINLKITDVDKDNLVINVPQLVDEDTGEILPQRQVPISSQTLRMIEHAMSETKYASLKGETSRQYSIADSEYILRGLRKNYQIKWNNVSHRIIRIAEIENYPYLNATNISYSGQVHYARELMKDGMPIDDACAEIIKRFNLSDNDSAHFYLKNRIEKANQLFNG